MTFVELGFGLVLLVLGGDALVRGAVAVARRLGVSPMLIGLTLVGFGTSTPELVTSLNAAALGSPGIAVGNIVGSNIANILLILGVAALIRPLTTRRDALVRDGSVMVAAALGCLGAAALGTLDRPVGVLFVGMLVTYVVLSYVVERRAAGPAAALHEREATAAEPGPRAFPLALLLTLGGLALTILGARLLVGAAITLAADAGVSETVIGLTVVAVGTSLPELVTSVVAALRGQGDVAFGNVIGSNIYNVWGILGLTALVEPITVPPEIMRVDIWVMLAATAMLVVFAFTNRRLERWEAAVSLFAYAGYVGYLATAA